MTRKTKADLTVQADADLADNISGQISPADVRNSAIDNIDSSAHSRIITEGGVMDYSDAATTTTPIVTPATVPTKLTNDGAGVYTNKTYKPDTVTDLWDAATNQLDFSELNLGDIVIIRFDVIPVTGSANTDLDISLKMAVGSATPYDLFVNHSSYKSAGTQNNMVRTMMLYIGDTNTKDYPAEIYATTDANATIIVNGWAIAIT